MSRLEKFRLEMFGLEMNRLEKLWLEMFWLETFRLHMLGLAKFRLAKFDSKRFVLKCFDSKCFVSNVLTQKVLTRNVSTRNVSQWYYFVSAHSQVFSCNMCFWNDSGRIESCVETFRHTFVVSNDRFKGSYVKCICHQMSKCVHCLQRCVAADFQPL